MQGPISFTAIILTLAMLCAFFPVLMAAIFSILGIAVTVSVIVALCLHQDEFKRGFKRAKDK